jgi:uncharacterized protein (TIGR02598 family)
LKGNPESKNSPPSRVDEAAFSLVEVVVALGIVSFAVLAIVGMLPVAMKSAQESMRETDATLIAQRIFSELKTGSGGNRTISTDSNTAMQVINLTANNSTNNFLGFKENGEVMGFTTSSAQNANLDFYAQISVFTNTGVNNLSRVQIDITAPAAAPPTARTTNSFITLLGF